MNRFIPLIALALVIVGLALVIAALLAGTAMGARASQWSELNKALTPYNRAIRGALEDAEPALGRVNEAALKVYSGSPINFAAMKSGAAELDEAVRNARAVLVRIRDNSEKAIAVLDDFGTEPCYRHFWAVSYTGYAALWDFSLLALASDPVGGSYAAGIHAFGQMADDEWAAVDCGEAAAPEASP